MTLPESTPRNSVLAWVCALTILVSAFLLFQVQPLMSKAILPWFGGSTTVWTTCMLFFQVMLLAGYAYAHLLISCSKNRWHAGLHVLFLATALFTLPILPASDWKPLDSAQPTKRILMLLLANVGLPYFLLSSTAPLIQAWYARIRPGGSPYRLYALSNLGSFGALLSYPFVFEPAFSVDRQSTLWSFCFGAFAVLCGFLAVQVWRQRLGESSPEQNPIDSSEDASGRASGKQWLSWLLLPAFGSMMLLAITNHICQDVAVVPFLWIAPLCLYLLSFVICFDRDDWYRPTLFGLATVAAIVVASLLRLSEDITEWFDQWGIIIDFSVISESIVVEAVVSLITLFLICMLCHGELARLRPGPRQLTSFYLMISLGGALGGIFVALICPLVFSTYLELNIGLMIAFVMGAVVVTSAGERTWLANSKAVRWTAATAAVCSFWLVGAAQIRSLHSTNLAASRNFYGVLRVSEEEYDDAELDMRTLMHGRIAHGVQYLSDTRRTEPTYYYTEGTGIGLLMQNYPREDARRVAVIGLGAGTLAAYGRVGDYYCFYEINGDVLDMATRYFTYLGDSKAEVEVVLGDARLSMEREASKQFDIIALDAFSGDAIPTHLLTQEAFEVYARHLRPGGVIAAHVSNKHLDLIPVVNASAERSGMSTVTIEFDGSAESDDTASDWMLVTTNKDFLDTPAIRDVATPEEDLNATPLLWTDRHSNLFQILK